MNALVNENTNLPYAEWDRFDICEAYYLLEMHWNVGGVLPGRKCSVSGQLHRINFKPRPSLGSYSDLCENAQGIYDCYLVRHGLATLNEVRTTHMVDHAEPCHMTTMELRGATVDGDPTKVYDDGSGPVWAYEESFGILGIVRADTFQSAWEIVTDEILEPISEEDVLEAYGFDIRELPKVGQFSLSTYTLHDESEYPAVLVGHYTSHGAANEVAHYLLKTSDRNLQEGYEYQSNASGTGIVQMDLNHHNLVQVTQEYLDERGITLEIVDGDLE